jgi:hypothetical protein
MTLYVVDVQDGCEKLCGDFPSFLADTQTFSPVLCLA